MVAIKAYFDGSGQANDRDATHLSLAGFCGTQEAWIAFHERWKLFLEGFDIPYLHMRERRNLFGTRERMWMGIGAAAKAILDTKRDWPGRFAATACTLVLPDYERACLTVPGLRRRKLPEAFCVDHCVTQALRLLHDPEGNLLGEDSSVELCFDQNEKFLAKVMTPWQRFKDEGVFPLISSIQNDDSRKVLPLQAADFLAWHANRHYAVRSEDVFPGLLIALLQGPYRYLDYDRIVSAHARLSAAAP